MTEQQNIDFLDNINFNGISKDDYLISLSPDFYLLIHTTDTNNNNNPREWKKIFLFKQNGIFVGLFQDCYFGNTQTDFQIYITKSARKTINYISLLDQYAFPSYLNDYTKFSISFKSHKIKDIFSNSIYFQKLKTIKGLKCTVTPLSNPNTVLFSNTYTPKLLNEFKQIESQLTPFLRETIGNYKKYSTNKLSNIALDEGFSSVNYSYINHYYYVNNNFELISKLHTRLVEIVFLLKTITGKEPM